jgi:hypothetical protein
MKFDQGDNGVANYEFDPSPPPAFENQDFRFSKYILRPMFAPPGYFSEPKEPLSYHNPFTLPTGHYFLYGTLADPNVLREVLSLETEPQLRPASIIGYECKLWGRHPALLDAPGIVFHGSFYYVKTERQGDIVADYETDSHQTTPCYIAFTDGGEPGSAFGYVFKFCGNQRDLNDDTFDLQALLGSLKKIAEESDVDVEVA